MANAHVPFKSRIMFPLTKGRCKKCKETYYWGKMKAGGRYFPPFANAEGTAWHVCGQAHASLADDHTTADHNEHSVHDNDTTTSKQQDIAHEREERKKRQRELEGKTTQELILDILSLSSHLEQYGRPTV